MLGYPVLMIEYERGWGSKPDGYLVFRSQETRDAYIKKEMGDRSGPVPDYYVNYKKQPPITLKPESESKFREEGFFYVDQLYETKPTV